MSMTVITPRTPYDKNNVFWQIITKKLPCNLIIETKYMMSFYDINPKANIHFLIIPKGQYIDFNDFFTHSSIDEKMDLYNILNLTVSQLNLTTYRIINNNGEDSGQEIAHYHWHILSGNILK